MAKLSAGQKEEALRRWIMLGEADAAESAQRRHIEKMLGLSGWETYHEAVQMLSNKIAAPPYDARKGSIVVMQSWIPESVRLQIAERAGIRADEDEGFWANMLGSDATAESDN